MHLGFGARSSVASREAGRVFHTQKYTELVREAGMAEMRE